MHYTKNWQPLVEITLPNLHEYCKKHGYQLDVKEVEPYKTYTGLEKLRQIQENLKNNGDIALVLDADTLITNHNIKVEDFLGKHYFYICEGINTGVFIIKKTDWSYEFIEHLIYGIKTGIFNCEQDAIEAYMTGFVSSLFIKICKHPAFNSYLSELYPEVKQPVTEQHGQWVEGSFVLHLPGLSLEKRIEIFKNTPIVK